MSAGLTAGSSGLGAAGWQWLGPAPRAWREGNFDHFLPSVFKHPIACSVHASVHTHPLQFLSAHTYRAKLCLGHGEARSLPFRRERGESKDPGHVLGWTLSSVVIRVPSKVFVQGGGHGHLPLASVLLCPSWYRLQAPSPLPDPPPPSHKPKAAP